MNERADTNNEATEDKGAGQKKGNKVLFLGILIGIIVLNAFMAFLLFQFTRPENPEALAAKAHADSLRMEEKRATLMGAIAEAEIEVIVNISGTQGERFLKAAIIFEYDDRKYPRLSEELNRRAPRYRDLLLNHLSKLTLFEVTEPQAREKIRKDLLRLVNNTLPEGVGEVRDVLFTQYIIQ
ncbi:flagellar basal body-associated FliL family protein [Chitinispirillales bacterium ANBcel5]|uniref:flagellar basal body-associated FliL family protein n=1 Tax=Cellulosispirillum alkaliphilum TaxID=3039283 RepID=UPI002A52DD9F|nr:flagellar basal body-associated FliL family protein [Chitinispirillales bacterium ANBcel5]